MCGILFVDCGAAGTSVQELRASGALTSLSHRGPDAYAELVLGNNHLLSFHRLAIVSTVGDAGMQPFATEDGKVAMVCSGEVYNCAELASSLASSRRRPMRPMRPMRSDVDVVLRMLLSGDDDDVLVSSPDAAAAAVARVDGDFAFVATDGRTVVAGRDPFGVRPLFYATKGGGSPVAFASEAKALVAAGLEDVRVFPPGFVCVDGTFVRHWHVDAVSATASIGHLPAPKGIGQLLKAAVEKRIRHSDQGEIAVLCSGGIDSAALACIAAASSCTKAIRIFTMRYRSGHSDDAFYAGLLCRSLRATNRAITHETLEFGPEDLGDDTIAAVVRACETCDPNTVRAAIPMYLLARRIVERAPGVKVVLSGEGADELFGGYGYFRLAPDAAAASDECDRLLRNLHMFDLLRADRCFAAHGLEVRVPFLDADLARHVASLPGGARTAGEKQLLRDAVAADFGLLKQCRVLDRPKEKFSDGAGFSYVPDLLRRLAAASPGGDDGTLPSRLRAEAAAYRAAFVAAFGEPAGRWVVGRTMPAWTDAARAASDLGGGLDAV